MEIVTGYRGQAHITAAQSGAFNAGMFGQGDYVMENGEQMSAAIITNNLIRISDGDIVMQGRHITIAKGTYEEVQIANGLAGMNRNDLIVVRYSKDSTTGIEDARLVVIQGVSTEGTAQDPEYQHGNILAGDLEADMPLYRIRLNGLNVEEPECLFEKQKSLHSIASVLFEMIYPVGSIYMSVSSVNPGSLFGGTWTAWGAGRVPVGVNTSDNDFKTVEKTGGAKTINISHTHTMTHTHGMSHTHTANHLHSLGSGYAMIGFNGPNRYLRNIQNDNSFTSTNITETTSAWTGDNTVTRATSLGGTTDGANVTTSGASSANTGGASNATTSAPSLTTISVTQPYITCYMWRRTA